MLCCSLTRVYTFKSKQLLLTTDGKGDCDFKLEQRSCVSADCTLEYQIPFPPRRI